MSTTGNEALESIKNERKGFNMTRDIVNLNIDIPADKKDIVAAFKALANAFKSDINVRGSITQAIGDNTTYQQAKDNFFNKYAGSLKNR